jgi:hypothetical protein
VKHQWVRCKLGETIEQPCSDVLVHTPEVCKGARLYNGYPAREYDHDSRGMCTTSAESQTVMTVMLTVMSGMDPHMISGTWVGLVWLGQFWSILFVRSILRSGLCGVIDVPLLRC